MDKVTVIKERLEKASEFIGRYCYDCDTCPASNICSSTTGITCKETITNYLLGSGFSVTIDVNPETTGIPCSL